MDPRDSRRVLVGISCGGVWLTRDRGETWETRCKGMYASFMPPERREDPNIQDPHRVVRCAGAPDHLWAQHHNGVFRSRDDGATWQELGRGLPQEHAYDLIYRHALAVDDSGDCLAMGSTTGSLWISQNQGDDWTIVNHHLPQIAALTWAG